MKTHVSKKTKAKVFEFDDKKMLGTYFPARDCAFAKLCQSMQFIGFPAIPKGFSRDGYGFASPAGSYLTNTLSEKFGSEVRLSISKNGKSQARKRGQYWHVALNHSDYLRILEPLRDIRRERNLKSNAHLANVLGEIFPQQFPKSAEAPSIYTYEQDKITKILGNRPDIHSQLSKADVETIASLYGRLLEDNKVDFSTISVAEESKRENERIYLQSVIEEFQKRLSNSTLSESDWQRFLQRYILLFNTSYVNVVEKLSVDLRGKYPDFLLVNVYGYLDVYEIKKPSTNLLRHDDSRDNFYWDVEVAKAIAQTEKYIQMLIKKDLEVRQIVKEKCGIDVKAVRPRGFIVVGNSKQFQSDKMNDDFRLLASALKNVDVILYDELLGNLNNLLNRLKGKSIKGATQK